MKGLKTGGREPGTCNIVTKEIRESFQSLIEQNLPEIQNWINSTAQKDPSKAVDLILKLSEFCLPKLKTIELTGKELMPQIKGITFDPE
jgi:hypothetical protein